MNIRPPVVDDWSAMADVAQGAHGYTPLLPGPFDRSIWIENWRTFSLSDRALILNLEIDGTVRGGICGSLTTNPTNNELIACMIWWHITPAYRGSGLKLLRRWIDLARERGAGRLTLNHLLDLDSKRMESLYLRMGMRPLEKTYILDL